MKKSVFKTITILLVVLVLPACSNGYFGEGYAEVTGDVWIFEDVGELANFATNIIRGEVLDKQYKWMDNSLSREDMTIILRSDGLTDDEIEYHLYGQDFEQRELDLVTLYTVLVLEVFKGDHQIGDIIEIATLGGEYEGITLTVCDAIEMESGSELIMFLFSWELIGQPYSLISHIQGVYYIPGELDIEKTVLEYEGFDIELESVSEHDPIFITLDDLIEIAEYYDLLPSEMTE